MSTDLVQIKTALLSVSDKAGLVPFAQFLASRGVKIISTGGTAKTLSEAGIAVTPIDQVTGFAEMMDGRVKTLHPRIHGGLLALRDKADHVAAMAQHGIGAIDLVCVNLYPFEQTVAKPGVTLEDAIENIDIGGPAMVRSSAKNHGFVAIATSPAQYAQIEAEMKANDGATTLSTRRKLALAAYTRTAEYDGAISRWMAGQFA